MPFGRLRCSKLACPPIFTHIVHRSTIICLSVVCHWFYFVCSFYYLFFAASCFHAVVPPQSDWRGWLWRFLAHFANYWILFKVNIEEPHISFRIPDIHVYYQCPLTNDIEYSRHARTRVWPNKLNITRNFALHSVFYFIFNRWFTVFSTPAWILWRCIVCRAYFVNIFIDIYAVNHCSSLIIVWACHRQRVLVIQALCQPFVAQILITATIMHCIMVHRRPKALYWAKRGEAQLSHRIRFCNRHLSHTTFTAQTQTVTIWIVFLSM